MSDKSAEILVVHNPLDVTDRRRVPVETGLTIRQVMALAEVETAIDSQAVAISVAGRLIEPVEFDRIRLAPDDILLAMPTTGEDEWVAAIAMIGLMYLSGGLAGALTGTKGGFWYTMVRTAIVVGGGYLINSWGGEPDKATPLLSEPGEKNQSHGWAPVTVQRTGPRPRLYGKVRTEGAVVEGFRYVTGPTTNIQKLYGLVCISDGPIHEPIVPGSLQLNDQAPSNYSADSIDYSKRHGDLTQYAMANHSRMRYETQPFLRVTHAAGPKVHETYGRYFDILEIDVTFPGGLYDGTGASIANHTVNVTVEIKKSTSQVWQTLATTDITDGTTSKVIRSFTTEGFLSLSPYEEYDVRLTKNTGDKDSPLWGDEVYLDTVREVLNYPLTRPGKALVAIEATETDNLSGAFRCSFISRGRYVRDVTDSFAIKYSRNFGLALYDAFTQPILTGSHSAWLDLELLLHFEGADNDTYTYDAAPYGHVVTFFSGAYIDTATQQFGQSALVLNGSTDYLSVADCGGELCRSRYDDWTVDLWVKHTDHAGIEYYLSCEESTNDRWSLYHEDGSGLTFVLLIGGATVISFAGGEITDTGWHHVALCKIGYEFGLYRDGSQVAYVSDEDYARHFGDLFIGKGGGGNFFDGALDEVRIINRNIFAAAPVSGLTDSFTPPVAAFSDPGNTYADGGHECYADSEMDLPAFVELAEWAGEIQVNPEKTYIDSITQEAEAIVTTRSVTLLGPGDEVLFRNVPKNGMVELVDGTTATVLSVVSPGMLRVDLDTSAFSPYESQTRLLYQFEGTDGDVFTNDASAQGHDIDSGRFIGGAKISEAQSKWGISSLYGDGAGDEISLEPDSDWEVMADTSEDWTIDMWVRHDDHAGTETYLACGSGSDYWVLRHEHGSGIRFFNRETAGMLLDTGAAGEISDTSWHHVAVIKKGTDIGTYLDGSQVGYDSMAGGDAVTYNDNLHIMAVAAGDYFAGHIDELRVAKFNPFEAVPVVGLTDSITVPSQSYTQESFAVVDLLLHGDGSDGATTTRDSSSNDHPVTFHGAELDTAYYKAGIASIMMSWTYISLAAHGHWDIFGDAATSRTLDLWVRLEDYDGIRAIASHYENLNNHWYLSHQAPSPTAPPGSGGLTLQVRSGGSYIIAMSNMGLINDSAWHHIALCKVADEYGVYLDGTQVGYAQTSNTQSCTAPLLFGRNKEGAVGPGIVQFHGHMDEIRITSDNYFSAAPDPGGDTIGVPTAPGYIGNQATGTLEEVLLRVPYDDVLTGEGNVWSVARRMCQLGRVTPYWKGSKVSVFINKAADPSYAFTMGNILRGSYRRRLIPTAERSSRITMAFRDAADDYTRTTRRVDNASMQDLTPYSKSRMDAFGLTNVKTVTDLATFRLGEAENVKWAVQIGVSVDAIPVTLGDVVLFQHDTANYGLIGTADDHYTGGGRIVAAANNDLTLADVDATDLAGHWPLNDNTTSTVVTDISGNGNNGTLGGGDDTVDKSVAGRIDSALEFNGIDDYVDCGNDSSLDWGSGDGAVACWFKRASISAAEVLVIKGADGASQKRYRLYMNATGNIVFEIDDDTTAKTVTSAAAYDDDIWHLAIGMRDGNDLKVGVDGGAFEVGDDVSGYGSIDDADVLTIAANNTSGSPGSDGWFAGPIDEVRVFTRSLTWSESLTLFYNGPRATVRIASDVNFLDADFDGGSTRYNLMVKSAGDVQDIVPIIGYDPATREIAATGPFTDLPQPDDIWAAGVENLQTKPFRVVDVEVDAMSHAKLDLMEYCAVCYEGD